MLFEVILFFSMGAFPGFVTSSQMKINRPTVKRILQLHVPQKKKKEKKKNNVFLQDYLLKLYDLSENITSWNPWLVSISRTRRLSVRTILKAILYRSVQKAQQDILSIELL